VVREYDEAIAYFVNALGFELVEDSDLGAGKRWVVVSPPDDRGAALLLARAATAGERARVGDQTGGRVGFFLSTDDFDRTYDAMVAADVVFLEVPRAELYGKVVVFEDLYGNRWDLIQPASFQLAL
jgi:catechol 2,3-dioxygenase-like lactoylglutathione lyase family enzyme